MDPFFGPVIHDKECPHVVMAEGLNWTCAFVLGQLPPAGIHADCVSLTDLFDR